MNTERNGNFAKPNGSGERIVGTVKFFNPDKGFGFIEREDRAPDVFVHVSDARDSGVDPLDAGDQVSFQLADGKKGKKAVNLELVGR